MKRSTLVLIMILLTLSAKAYAMDAMRLRIRTHLPNGIETVGQAAQYYAVTIGYRLTVDPPAPSESYRIATELLSPLARTDRILPVSEAILALLKDNYRLVIDTKNKLFSFEAGAE